MSSVPALQRICEACTGVQVDPRSSAAHRMCVKPGLALGSGVSLGSGGSDSVAQFACNLHNAMFLNVQSLPPLTHSPQMRKDSLKAYGLNNTLNKMQDSGWWSEVSTYGITLLPVHPSRNLCLIITFYMYKLRHNH